VLVTHDDISSGLGPAEARSKEEESMRLLLELTRVLPWEADFETQLFTSVGPQAVSMLGYPIEDWYQPDFWESHLHPEDRERATADANKYSGTCSNYEIEYRMIASDGRVVWLHNLISVICKDGKPKTIRGFSIDVTRSKHHESALRDLTGRLINAQEEERRRVARELHDDLNQRMALLSIGLEQLGQKVKKPFNLHRSLESLQLQAQEISTDIHQLSYKLHPSKLDHLGVAAAIRSLCQEMSAKGKLDVDFQQSGFPAVLPSDVTLCIFRIAQEALRNCVKHSGATAASVELHRTEKEISLTVSDEGRGFDTQSEAMEKGLGFTGMRERIRIVDGHINIFSEPGQGTVITVSVPLGREHDALPVKKSMAPAHGFQV
jgi:PAS domain S-box-containing protein